MLLLQETSKVRGRDPVPWLRQRLPGWNAVSGGDVAILSLHRLEGATRHFSGTSRLRPDRAAGAGADAGHVVEVVVVHFHTALPRPLRERAWTPRYNMEVAAAVRRSRPRTCSVSCAHAPRPLVVGGDFNSPPGRSPLVDRPPSCRAPSRRGRRLRVEFPVLTPSAAHRPPVRQRCPARARLPRPAAPRLRPPPHRRRPGLEVRCPGDSLSPGGERGVPAHGSAAGTVAERSPGEHSAARPPAELTTAAGWKPPARLRRSGSRTWIPPR